MARDKLATAAIIVCMVAAVLIILMGRGIGGNVILDQNTQ
jgi:hypothetical protein